MTLSQRVSVRSSEFGLIHVTQKVNTLPLLASEGGIKKIKRPHSLAYIQSTWMLASPLTVNSRASCSCFANDSIYNRGMANPGKSNLTASLQHLTCRFTITKSLMV